MQSRSRKPMNLLEEDRKPYDLIARHGFNKVPVRGQ